MTALYAVDLFCGVGGLTRGLLDAGVTVLAGYDLDPACRYPYEHNNGVPFVETDVNDLDPAEVTKLFPEDGVRVIVGCAPCQPYSNYSRSKRVYEKSWHLLGAYGRLVEGVRPELATIENVVQLRKHPSYAQLAKKLKDLGYDWTEYEVQCLQYGVPQSRVRLVAFASLLGPVKLAPPTHRPGNYVTLKNAIGGMPKLTAGQTYPRDRYHTSAGLSEINLKRIRESKPGGTWRDWDENLRAACHKAKTGKTYPSVYGRLEWENESSTITTQFYGFGSGRFGHPEQDRALSLREGALLQTFPAKYQFVDPEKPVHFKTVGRLIGNAVPVRLGRAVARSLKRHVERHRG